VSLHWDEEGLITIIEDDGNRWAQWPDELILARDGSGIVLDLSPHGIDGLGPLAICIPEDRSRIFHLASGLWERDRYERIEPISCLVFSQGVPADPDVVPGSEPFLPHLDAWAPLPSDKRFPDGDHFENITVHTRRFSRLSAVGLAAAKRAKEAAERERIATANKVEQDRLDAEAEAAAKRREQEKLAREAQEADQLREAEKAKLAAQQAWLQNCPPNMMPGALVVDMTESNPRVCEVRYGIVWRDGDQYYFNSSEPTDIPCYDYLRLHGATQSIGNQ
jgi:hypothetical protein